MIKSIALDLDGTCLNSRNQISINTMSALKEAAKRGMEIVFVTGRAYAALPAQILQETFYRYVITSNGADILDVKTGESIYRSQIPLNIAQPLLTDAKRSRLGLSVHVDHEYVIEGRFLYDLGRVVYGKDSEQAICVKDIRDYVAQKGCSIEEVQVFFFTANEKRRADALIASYPQLNKPAGPFYVEFVAQSTTKGNALEWLYTRNGLQKAEIACIGDGENDIPMFQKSGKRFAMGNADVNLKMIADEVVPSNDEDGVAYAIDYILSHNR